MQVTLDIEKAKQQAKQLVGYLTGIRRRVTHSQALEAVARMHGSREWNELAARLGAAPATEASAAALPPKGQVAGRFDETGGTGRVLVLAPGAKNLTEKQLREITDDGEFRLCVAVSVELSAIVDGDLEELNDAVAEAITGFSADLSDIGYERYSPDNEAALHDMRQNVFLLVNAGWEPPRYSDDAGTSSD